MNGNHTEYNNNLQTLPGKYNFLLLLVTILERNETSINIFIMSSVHVALQSVFSFALMVTELALVGLTRLVMFGLNVLLHSCSVLRYVATELTRPVSTIIFVHVCTDVVRGISKKKKTY